MAADGVLNLTVPVQKGKTQCTTGEVGVVNRTAWGRLHQRTMATCYGRAPFYAHYMPQLEAILGSTWQELAHLNLATIRWAEKVLGLDPAQVVPSGASIDHTYILMHGALHPKKPLGNSGNGIEYQPYPQCFSLHKFVPGLSIIDLIMNQGPQAYGYLPTWPRA